MSEKLKAILAELRRRFERIYADRLAHMVLYGSHARAQADEGSDIDVLVVLRGPVDPGAEVSRTGQAVADMSLRNDVVIGCLFMELDRFTQRNGPLLRNIRREGLPV